MQQNKTLSLALNFARSPQTDLHSATKVTLTIFHAMRRSGNFVGHSTESSFAASLPATCAKQHIWPSQKTPIILFRKLMSRSMTALQNCTTHSTLAFHLLRELINVKDFCITLQQIISKKPCANLPAALMHKKHCQTRGTSISRIRSCYFLKLFLFYISVSLRRYTCFFTASALTGCYSQETPCCKSCHKALAPKRNYYLAKRSAHLRKN